MKGFLLLAVVKIAIVVVFNVRIGVMGCTDILVTPGASSDASAMIAYNADSPTLYGYVYHYPATQNNPPGTMRSIYDWDSGVYLGEISEANVTFNVVGNSNERGLVIGETTFGGVKSLAWTQTDGVMDYGSLIYVTLQRTQTCREAIQMMSYLMDTYGYYSGGESFSLMDRTGEVWMMEVIGRGPTYGKKGAVWVAQRIPDGMVAAHANQARIRTFPRDDPDNFLFAPDVVDVAVHYGLYPSNADPNDFSFSDVYCPVDFINARQGEARVWSIFSQIADPNLDFQFRYAAYALGADPSDRMPLYVKPYRKLSVMDVANLMASHYEGTVMDASVDVGAGLFGSPYRPRPLVWTLADRTYHNERSIATAKTGWSFVAQVRPWMPPELSSLLWFACDDSSTAPRVPIYSSSTKIAPPYDGKGSQDGFETPIMEFDLRKAFWVQNMVSNFAYYRWNDVYPILRKKIETIQLDFQSHVAQVDQKAIQVYHAKGVEEAVNYVTMFSVTSGKKLHQKWMTFYGELFVQFRDFYTFVPKEDEKVCRCEAKEPGLSEQVKQRIVNETGNHYRVPTQKKPNDQPDIVRGEMKSAPVMDDESTTTF